MDSKSRNLCSAPLFLSAREYRLEIVYSGLTLLYRGIDGYVNPSTFFMGL